MSERVTGDVQRNADTLRLTVDEYGTVWHGEPGDGEVVGDLSERDEETFQIVWTDEGRALLDGLGEASPTT